MGLEQGKAGRIVVEPDLRVRGQQRIFAVGDVAVGADNPLPQLAQPALQMGRHAAAQIRSLDGGDPTVPFSYRDKGMMATIGRSSAVVQLGGGQRFRGLFAWLAWLGLHLVTLLGNRNRISALINLSWRYLSCSHGGGLIVGDAHAQARLMPATGKDRSRWTRCRMNRVCLGAACSRRSTCLRRSSCTWSTRPRRCAMRSAAACGQAVWREGTWR